MRGATFWGGRWAWKFDWTGEHGRRPRTLYKIKTNETTHVEEEQKCILPAMSFGQHTHTQWQQKQSNYWTTKLTNRSRQVPRTDYKPWTHSNTHHGAKHLQCNTWPFLCSHHSQNKSCFCIHLFGIQNKEMQYAPIWQARSHSRQQKAAICMLVVCNCDINGTFAEPLWSREDKETLWACDKTCTTLTKHGHEPKLNVMDNEASAVLKQKMQKTGGSCHLVKPHNHCVNAVERALHTFKNHFIAGSCITDPNFSCVSLGQIVGTCNPDPEVLAHITHQFTFVRSCWFTWRVWFQQEASCTTQHAHACLQRPGNMRKLDTARTRSMAFRIYVGSSSMFPIFVPETGGNQISGTAEFLGILRQQ